MNNRLRNVRKALKINQADFAAKIGIVQSGYSQMETGKNALTERNIKLICLVFGINETWLRSGEGEMFDTVSKPQNDEEKTLLRMFRHLSPEMRAFILRKVQECLQIDREFTRP